jgi:hypothetical protein
MRITAMLPAAICLLLLNSLARAVTFDVSFDATTRSEPASGRVTVFLVKEDSAIGKNVEPAGEYFFGDPQPIYGVDVKDLAPGTAAHVDDSATSFPVKLSALPPGKYRGQAVLDMFREKGDFRAEPGNLFSDVVKFEVPAEESSVAIKLTRVVAPKVPPIEKGVSIVDIKSELLSKFRGKETHLRAGVVWPLDFDPKRKYAALYLVPGFGGNHLGAFGKAAAIAKLAADAPQRDFYRNVFWIVLDPDGPNAHTLFADSEVNGPCGEALVKELIPAIEGKFPLIREPNARMLRGHSSGGWSVLWLAVNYPQVFGACWAWSPDPISFHRLERIDIYEQENAYVDRDSTPQHLFDAPSYRPGGVPKCTVRIENLMEEVVGPDNSSAGQWDSWQAVFGHRNARGNPAALFDPITGEINRAEADFYKKHDIEQILLRAPQQIAQIFQRRIRLIVGANDEYYLNEATQHLKATLEKLAIQTPAIERHGYVKIVAGAGHGNITQSADAKAFETDAMDHLRRCGY